jgi:O-antigen ligase
MPELIAVANQTRGMSRRFAIALAAILDLTVIASLAMVGPVAAICAFALGTYVISCLFLNIGFTAILAAISGITVLGDIDFNLIRAGKWALVAAFGIMSVARLGLGGGMRELKLDFVVKYFILYLGWGALCSIFAVHPGDSLSFALMKFMFLAIYLLTIAFVSGKRDVDLILGVLLVYVLASGLYSFAGLYHGPYTRFRGFADNPNGFGAALSVVVPLLLAACYIYTKRVIRWLFACGVTLGIFCIALCWSRGAWVANLVAAVVFLIMEKKRKTLVALVVLTAVISIIVVTSSSAFSVFYEVARLRGGGTTHRTTLWEYALKEIRESPIVGKGFEVTNDDVMGNVRGADPITGYFLADREIPFNPHSYYLLPTVATGIPGLIIFLYFFYNLFKSQYRGWRTAVDSRYRILHAAMFSMLAGAAVGFLVDSGLIMSSGSNANYFWIALGMVTAISRKQLLGETTTARPPTLA